MKATGIVRRIDDLGRIVIPKEIRRTLRIKEGAPLEIFTTGDGEILLKKYSPIGELGDFAESYSESLAGTTGHLICVTDHDSVIVAAGPGKKHYLGKRISSDLESLIDARGNLVARRGDSDFRDIIQDDPGEYVEEAIATIISGGDAIGAVVMYGKGEKEFLGTAERQLVISAANFLGRQME